MSKFKYISIVTDLNKFQDRVDEITSETTFDEVKATISDMKKYLNTNKDAVCLCAPQIGVNLRLFIVKCPICGKSDQQWIDVAESSCEEINTGESVLIKWDNVKYSEL